MNRFHNRKDYSLTNSNSSHNDISPNETPTLAKLQSPSSRNLKTSSKNSVYEGKKISGKGFIKTSKDNSRNPNENIDGVEDGHSPNNFSSEYNDENHQISQPVAAKFTRGQSQAVRKDASTTQNNLKSSHTLDSKSLQNVKGQTHQMKR